MHLFSPQFLSLGRQRDTNRGGAGWGTGMPGVMRCNIYEWFSVDLIGRGTVKHSSYTIAHLLNTQPLKHTCRRTQSLVSPLYTHTHKHIIKHPAATSVWEPGLAEITMNLLCPIYLQKLWSQCLKEDGSIFHFHFFIFKLYNSRKRNTLITELRWSNCDWFSC